MLSGDGDDDHDVAATWRVCLPFQTHIVFPIVAIFNVFIAVTNDPTLHNFSGHEFLDEVQMVVSQMT